MPSTVRCIAYNFDGSNVEEGEKDHSKLRYEDGRIIPNVKEYFM
jgi:hypothetical protein